MLKDALRIAGDRRAAGKLPLAPSPVFAEQCAETIEPVAFEPDRNRVLGPLRPETEPRQFGPSQSVPQRLGCQHLKSVGLHGLHRGAPKLQHLGDEIP